MEESALRQALSGLVAEITIPRTTQPIFAALLGSEEPPAAQEDPIRKLADARDVPEHLDHLRVSIKYLLFDLEATRRENTYLRRMIEQHSCESGHEE
jgi:hypothetical protein